MNLKDWDKMSQEEKQDYWNNASLNEQALLGKTGFRPEEAGIEFGQHYPEARTECADVATKVIKIYAVSDALTHGWRYLEPERRAESIGRLVKRVADLSEAKQISPDTATAVLGRLQTLQKYNSGEGTMHDIPEKLLPAVVDMAVDAILDCGCRQGGVIIQRDMLLTEHKAKPTRGQVRVEEWAERDRHHIGIQVKDTGEYLASWWDDDARQMFEDGFFLAGRDFENSVLGYAEDMGILAK